MNKTKSTKRALLTSALALIMCIAMLVGTTFAWFTDSVTSGRNTITSGNLDVELYYSAMAEDGSWSEYAPVTGSTNVLADALWEPGYTQVVKFKVVNKGSLAVKYEFDAFIYNEKSGINVYGDEFKLSESLKFGVTSDVAAITDRASAVAVAEWDIIGNTIDLTAALEGWGGNDMFNPSNPESPFATSHYITEKDYEVETALVITMPTTVGNEANHNGTNIPSIEFGVSLVATQYTAEEDSFGDDYDADATYPELPVAAIAEAPEYVNTDLEWASNYNYAPAGTQLDTAYTFGTTETADEAKASPYRYWHADYVISFDKDIATGTAGIAGSYDTWDNGNWLGFPVFDVDTEDGFDGIKANTELRLLDTASISMNYEELCLLVKEFRCGAWDVNGANAGTTMTVELRLYETEAKSADNQNSHNVETGAYKVVSTTTYTF